MMQALKRVLEGCSVSFVGFNSAGNGVAVRDMLSTTSRGTRASHALLALLQDLRWLIGTAQRFGASTTTSIGAMSHVVTSADHPSLIDVRAARERARVIFTAAPAHSPRILRSYGHVRALSCRWRGSSSLCARYVSVTAG